MALFFAALLRFPLYVVEAGLRAYGVRIGTEPPQRNRKNEKKRKVGT